MPPFKPVLLEAVGVADGHTLAGYKAAAAMRRWRASLEGEQPGDVVEMVKASGLRGRGGRRLLDGPQVARSSPRIIRGRSIVCINADESEPGTFNNRILIEDDPHQVIEGTIISAYRHAGQHRLHLPPLRIPARVATALQAAIDEAYARRLSRHEHQGQRLLARHLPASRRTRPTSAARRPGLIESLEGKRAWPRIKPPFPAIEGLFRKPTVVNNIETMACVSQIARRGIDWFKSIGVPADPANPRDPGSYGPSSTASPATSRSPAATKRRWASPPAS